MRVGFGLFFLLAACSGSKSLDSDLDSDSADDTDSSASIEDISVLLAPLLERHDVPALGAAVIEGGELVAYGAVGVRAAGMDVSVTRDDLWHLGSDTKAMTATLLATFVVSGELSWDTTLVQAFPDIYVHEDLQAVTLRALLAHEGGLWTSPPASQWDPLWQPGDVVAQREVFTRAVLTAPPTFTPGTEHYSNAGYMVVGAAMEAKSGQSWEDLMRERLFAPLGMTDCGFGGTSDNADTPVQPWGHDFSGQPVPPDGSAGPDDNPPALGPAGTVHCSLPSWSRFIVDQLAGHRGEAALLPAEQYSILHEPVGQQNALGWFVVSRPWAGGVVLTHVGSNTLNLAVAWLGPNNDLAYIATTNIAGSDGSLGGAVTDAAIVALMER